jgi:hypothetical protein
MRFPKSEAEDYHPKVPDLLFNRCINAHEDERYANNTRKKKVERNRET